MPEIFLRPDELEQGGLPDVCVVCGAHHTTPTPVRMHIQIADNPLFRTLRYHDVRLPLCSGHKWHFYRHRIHILVGGLCMAMFLPCMALTTFAVGPFVRNLSFGWVFAIAGLVIPWIVGAIIMYVGKYGNVEAADITQEGILVVNVSERFVESVMGARHEERE